MTNRAQNEMVQGTQLIPAALYCTFENLISSCWLWLCQSCSSFFIENI